MKFPSVESLLGFYCWIVNWNLINTSGKVISEHRIISCRVQRVYTSKFASDNRWWILQISRIYISCVIINRHKQGKLDGEIGAVVVSFLVTVFGVYGILVFMLLSHRTNFMTYSYSSISGRTSGKSHGSWEKPGDSTNLLLAARIARTAHTGCLSSPTRNIISHNSGKPGLPDCIL